mmetsp:Transcript_62187/g.128975  ORF Transcript_62187/g.128975 Transcript_62187/m.128975 type:complete len:183 (-) Transcript_62187:1137-1685(-)
MWSVWLAAFEREFTHYTLENLSKDLIKNMDTYIRMKRAELKTEDEEAGDLVNFNAREGRSRDRQSPARERRPREGWNRRHSEYDARNSRSHYSEGRDREEGRGRERGSPYPRGDGGGGFRPRGGKTAWKTRSRSEGRDRDQRGERRYPYRDDASRDTRYPAKPSRDGYSPRPSASNELNEEG